MTFSFKKLIATFLIIAMTFTSAGFTTFAESVDDVVTTTQSSSADNLSSKNHEEQQDENTGDFLASPSDADDEESYNGEYETEPEDDETTTVAKSETDETTTVAKSETDETTTVAESETDETTTVAESETDETTTVVESETDESTSVTTENDETTITVVDPSDADSATISEAEEANDEAKNDANTVRGDDQPADADTATTSDVDDAANTVRGDDEPATASETKEATKSNILKELVNISTNSDTTLFGTAPNEIWLGTYPQSVDASTAGAYDIVEPIKWRKLSETGTEALYIADKILDNVSYHNTYTNTTWAGCGMHTWLNDTSVNGFIGKAFTANQLNDTTGIVKEKEITTTGSVNTNDKAILLSTDDAQNLFANDDSRKANVTNYSSTHLNNGSPLLVNGGCATWWLRSPGNAQSNATNVVYHGSVYGNGDIVNINYFGTRPAIYLNLASPLYKDSNNGVAWVLPTGVNWKANSTLWSSMDTYQGGQKLPTLENLDTTKTNFRGWRISSDGGATYDPTFYTEIPVGQTGDITFSPLFAPLINYYETKDATVATNSLARNEDGSGAIVATPGEAKVGWEAPRGYEFDAWYATPSDTRITDLNIPAGNYDEVNVYPRWKEITYHINYYETKTSATPRIVKDRTYTESYTLASPSVLDSTWTNPGYTFINWLRVEDDTVITDVSALTTENINVYPSWASKVAPNTLWLGTYPQSVNAGTAGAYNITEPIKWRKLSQSGTEALYVADQILDNVSYHNSYASITWAGSSIHSWLNNTTATGFIGKAFTTNQLNDTTGIVKEKTITTDGSVNTNDKAFLLSKDEAQNSFASPDSRKASGTTYAKTHLNDGTALAVNGGYSYWWCRSPGIDNGSAAGVYYDGYVNSNGAGVGDHDRGVRPAFYLNLASPLFKDSNNGVTWDLIPGTSWKTGSNMWSQMNTYQGGQKLPTVENIANTVAPVPFRGWQINHTEVIYTEIPIDQTGDIVLTPVFAPQVNYYENKDDSVATISYARRESGIGSIKATPGEAKAGWEAPRGYEFDAWYAIPSDTRITDLNIPAGNYDDINVYPRYKLINYPITWTLGDGTFINPSIASPSYTYGTEWPLPVAHDLYIPRGREFDHWEIKQNGVVIDNNATVIPATYEGAIEIIVKYKNLSYNITWDLGTAPDAGSWVDPSVASASYTYGTNWPLPDKSKVNGPTGREFDYWTIKQSGKADITHATVISSTTYDDVTIVATYKNSSYKITWDLGTAPDKGSWKDSSVASASYTYGTTWPLPDKTKINGPVGRELNYWTIKQTGKADVTQATEISATTYGDVTIVATYKNLSYKITWVMNGATLKTGALAEDYTYGTGLILPASTSITMPAGQEFAYWTVNGVETDRISTTQIDPVTVTLINTEMASKTHKITWDYAKGKADEWSFVGFTAPETFIEEIALMLPDASKVKPKNVNRELNYWTVNGVKATEIAATTKVDVTIAAVLKDKGGEDKDVDFISIVTNPKTSYSEGSKFDPSGLVIKANYTDGSTANITYSKANANEFSFNPTLTTRLTVDMKTVEIGYKGKTTTLNITVKKIWEDNNDQDGIRPKKLIITIMKTSEEETKKVKDIELNAGNNWSETIEGLLKYEDGIEYTYTAEEIDVPKGYEVSYSEDTFTITNTHEVEKIDITVKKEWKNDDDYIDEVRPESVTIFLFANGEKIETIELSKENDWAYTFKELDVYENKKEIEYTIDEQDVGGYKKSITGNSEEGFIVTNEFTGEIGDTVPPITGIEIDNNSSIIPFIFLVLLLLLEGINISLNKQN